MNSEIFVDKTEMIAFLNSIVKTKQKYVSVSRPRRFGKTIAADMICAYYDREADNRELFEKRKLSQVPEWDRYLGKFDVIRIVMTDFFKEGMTVSKSLEKLQKLVINELIERYPDVFF